jgi:hypothetical protein
MFFVMEEPKTIEKKAFSSYSIFDAINKSDVPEYENVDIWQIKKGKIFRKTKSFIGGKK